MTVSTLQPLLIYFFMYHKSICKGKDCVSFKSRASVEIILDIKKKFFKRYLSNGKSTEIIASSVSFQRGIDLPHGKPIILKILSLDAIWSHLSIYEATHIL